MPPVDPSIPLSVRPPQPVDLASIFAQQASLKSLGLQQQIQQQQVQENEAKITEAQRQQAGRDALAQAIQQNTKPDPKTGTATTDHEAVATAVSQQFPDIAESYLKSAASNREILEKFREQDRAHNELQASTLGDLAFRATTPADFTSALALAATHGLIDQQDADKLEQAEQQAGPNGWQTLKTQLQQFSPEWKKQQDEQNKAVKIGEGDVLNTPARALAGLAPMMTGGAKPEETQSKSMLLDGKPAEVVFHPKTSTYTLPGTTTDVSSRIAPIPSAASVSINAGSLTDTALDQAAQRFLDSGVLPPGFGTAGVMQKTKIMNRAAEIDPKAALARNQAVYHADTGNLLNLQKTEGTLSAFENTAGKNLDQFLTLADKIPDTGIPWLNTPVRQLDVNVVGSANMAAINAARDVAMREIARVTNDPKLSGALTDSARAEVLGLSPTNATLPQIKAVARVLKQDMANVHAGLNQQIESIKSGIGSNPTAGIAQSAGMIRARDPQGILNEAKAGTALPPGWTLEK